VQRANPMDAETDNDSHRDVDAIIRRIMEADRQRQEALGKELVDIVRGNPGALFAGIELHKEGHFDLVDLVPLLRRLGLVGNAFYILHKEFGGKDPEATARILRTLEEDADASFPRVRGGEQCKVVDYCITQMQLDA